jgi:N-carbamoylputrescine amidase
MHGAEILFYPTAIGWLAPEKAELGEKQHQSWEIIQRSHAVANGCYVASVNRVGREAPAGGQGIEFWGCSFVAGPMGEVIAKASPDKEELLLADVDFTAIRNQRESWPFLRDRRIDAYGGLTKRFLA